MSGNPSAWNPGELDLQQAQEFRAFLDRHPLRPVFLHAGYLINLACRTGRNAPLYAKSIILLKATMARAAALSCEYVVVHMGSRRGTSLDEGLESLIEGICRLDEHVCGPLPAGSGIPATQSLSPGAAGLPPGTPMLLLENSASSGKTIGASFEEMAAVLSTAGKRGVRLPLGICLDTAHLWGAGYDLGSAAAARRLVEEFDSTVGVSRLHLIHFNDSPVVRGSRRDQHEHVGHGLISEKGLKAIVRHPKLRPVAMIMETPGKSEPSDQQRMDDLRALAGLQPV